MSPPTILQASARRATARSVICSPPPGRGFWTGFGSRIASSTWKYREGRTSLGPHLQDQLDRFPHLPDAGRRLRRERPAVLLVFILERAGADAERQSSPADQIDGRRDPGEVRGIAITDRRGQGGETDAAGDGGQPRQDGPAFQERLGGRAHTGDLGYLIQDPGTDQALI